MSRECCGGDDELEDRPALVTGLGLTPASPRTPDGAPADSHDEHDGEDEELAPWWRDRALLLPALSGVLLAVGYALEWSDLATPALVVQSASLLAGAWTFVPGAVRRLARGKLGVGLLMTIAAVGAVALGHVGEAAALAFLFSIAEALEDRAMDRAKHGLRALLDLMPTTARVSRLSGDVEIPAADVRELDLLVVRAGERLATDGVVTSGRSSLDTSAITGESIPVEVGPGDAVPAGAINGGGALLVEASADGRDNSLTTIVHLVEQAQARKGERARLADRIAKPLVPIVLVAAALVVVWGFVVGDPGLWTERALVVLVAASPCALAIAVPVTVISAIGAASRFGMIVKSGAAFEELGTVRAVAIDKTGTLTRNRPEVVQVRTRPGTTREQALAWAGALEARSTHPLAAAILAAASAPVRPAGDVQELPGRGLHGTVDGVQVRVGTTRWIDPGPFEPDAATLEGQGMTVVVVAAGDEPVALVGIRDELRPEAAHAVRQLALDGVTVTMLTGDNERTARALAAQAGISEVRAAQMPQDKEQAVRASAEHVPTAMIGDGVNDAPALAAANVGIAMGVGGSAAAIESADVAFTGNDLRLVPQGLAHARRGRRIMTGNIVLALAIIIVLFPLALFGVLGLAGVVLVHEIAEVVVILNGVRAARGTATLTALPTVPAPTRPAPTPTSTI
ncbi:heavy metal translocating P-type ATPase [Cellulosimicrobium sp. SH8]|uniref:heavy metal translocating P-type ATPase n=2 Tax=unclassified Cellulosimicrobium TaxID=2624466 RepID=UPI0021F33422|nr:cation-translocating P-type ATPase [Cellulosimicrobium sp. SH8]